MEQLCQFDNENGVSGLLEYIAITGTLILLMVIMTLYVNPVFIEGPTNQLTYYAFTDIGNGISTRIVDLYVIAPKNGTIDSKFDIPDEVAGKGYFVDIITSNQKNGTDQLIVSGANTRIQMALSGIGATTTVSGRTSSSGLNEITYTP